MSGRRPRVGDATVARRSSPRRRQGRHIFRPCPLRCRTTCRELGRLGEAASPPERPSAVAQVDAVRAAWDRAFTFRGLRRVRKRCRSQCARSPGHRPMRAITSVLRRHATAIHALHPLAALSLLWRCPQRIRFRHTACREATAPPLTSARVRDDDTLTWPAGGQQNLRLPSLAPARSSSLPTNDGTVRAVSPPDPACSVVSDSIVTPSPGLARKVRFDAVCPSPVAGSHCTARAR